MSAATSGASQRKGLPPTEASGRLLHRAGGWPRERQRASAGPRRLLSLQPVSPWSCSPFCSRSSSGERVWCRACGELGEGGLLGSRTSNSLIIVPACTLRLCPAAPCAAAPLRGAGAGTGWAGGLVGKDSQMQGGMQADHSALALLGGCCKASRAGVGPCWGGRVRRFCAGGWHSPAGREPASQASRGCYRCRLKRPGAPWPSIGAWRGRSKGRARRGSGGSVARGCETPGSKQEPIGPENMEAAPGNRDPRHRQVWLVGMSAAVEPSISSVQAPRVMANPALRSEDMLAGTMRDGAGS